SFNQGKSWRTLTTTSGTVSARSDVKWWINFSGAPVALLIDPVVGRRLWLTDWSGTWISDDYRAAPLTFRTEERGHEELVVTSLVTAPVGAPLLSAVADAKGFRHDQFDRFPLATFDEAGIWASFGMDYSPSNLTRLVRAGVRGGYGPDAQGGLALSKDNGRTW